MLDFIILAMIISKEHDFSPLEITKGVVLVTNSGKLNF